MRRRIGWQWRSIPVRSSTIHSSLLAVINDGKSDNNIKTCYDEMATRRLVYEVLFLSPEHKTSIIILNLVYDALQKHLPTFESTMRLISDDVKVSFSSIVRDVFRRCSTLGTDCSHVHFCHLRATKIQSRFKKRNYGFGWRYTCRLGGSAKEVERSHNFHQQRFSSVIRPLSDWNLLLLLDNFKLQWRRIFSR